MLPSENRTVSGTCHICGASGPLSFEHIPPRKAFNDRPVVVLTHEESIGLGPDEIAKGPLQQPGMGAHTLCGSCNNNMGGWYARAFVEWCYRGMAILEASGGNPKLVYAHHMYPLRVIKQIIAMFFSVHHDGWRLRRHNQELVRLLLNKEGKGLPPGYRVYAYFNCVGTYRSNAVSAWVDIYTGENSTFAEITFPPFGYVMTFDSKPPDKRLFDITHFAYMDYREQRSIFLDLPVLPTHLGFSGDYRTKAEIYRDARLNDAHQQ